MPMVVRKTQESAASGQWLIPKERDSRREENRGSDRGHDRVQQGMSGAGFSATGRWEMTETREGEDRGRQVTRKVQLASKAAGPEREVVATILA